MATGGISVECAFTKDTPTTFGYYRENAETKMSDQIPVPPELQHLMEKREQSERRNDHPTDSSASEPGPDHGKSEPSERRSGKDRRHEKDVPDVSPGTDERG